MTNNTNGKKWISGQAVRAGDYIDIRIVFKPETIQSQDSNGKPYTVTQVYSNLKGKGKFAQGQVMGFDDQNRPISFKIVGKLGNPPKPTQSSASVSVATML